MSTEQNMTILFSYSKACPNRMQVKGHFVLRVFENFILYFINVIVDAPFVQMKKMQEILSIPKIIGWS